MNPVHTRRSFLRSVSHTSAGLVIVSSQTAFGFSANEKVKLGSVGCGGRGRFVAEIFKEHGKFEFSAAADYFEDNLTAYSEKYGVPADKRFTGLNAYKKLLESGVDAVAIHSPPYFHPTHAADSIDAGKHVFLAKPIAIDVPGTQSVVDSAQRAAGKNLVLLVDFQSRGDSILQEAMKRVHGGALGDFCFGDTIYEADTLPPKSKGNGPEDRLRNWVFWKDLSGDIITEQNIHALDVMSWALGKPVKATGLCGRKVRTNVGDTADHYSILFEFPGGGAVNFHSRQYSAWGVPFTCANRHYGTKGALFTEFGGRVMIRGGSENAWGGGVSKDLYKSGSVANVKTFYEAMLAGKSETSTVQPSADTNLTTIFGRFAAEKGRTVTWDDMLKESVGYKPDLAGLNP
jgi:predicted dehydrogenase